MKFISKILEKETTPLGRITTILLLMFSVSFLAYYAIEKINTIN